MERVSALKDLPLGTLVPVPVAGRELVLVRYGEAEVACYRDLCSHQAIKLSEFASVEPDGAILCHAHGAKFCSQSGAPLCHPARSALEAYPVVVQAGEVYIELKESK